ncbi:MAG: AAA family ATPase [Desulfobacterales bacterium]|nr:AAA family ATPase [Desulfobacterales bacterium]
MIEKIYESQNSIIFSSKKNIHKKPVILKMLKNEYPSQDELSRFKREFEITQRLKMNGIIEVYALEKYNNTLVMILEDFGGESLERTLNKKKLEFIIFLNIAIQLTEILSKIHNTNIIHKDINPANIILNAITGTVKIIDFGISTELSTENQEILNPKFIEGSLAYISPEQTGRMNRTVDYRSDYYSLGVTFYKMLSNKLPFEVFDPMELIHSHIAKMPVPLHQLNPTIYKPISDIVSKLMAKTAEDRYQSAFGIIADLKLCLKQFEQNGVIENFLIGQKDISKKFRPPQKLYGREKEIEMLWSAFNDVSEGSKKIVIIPGSSGIGKSAIVHEIYKPITEKRGYFISGKYDQFKKNIPYTALIQAFCGLIRQFLAESEDNLIKLRENLLKFLGPNGQLIISVLPELELIIGRHNPPEELPPAESQNRFNIVFKNFVRAFTSRDHPVVIFIDDLQWSDIPSIKMIELLMNDIDINHILIICAYRDNEITEAHPVELMFENLQKVDIKLNKLILNNLSLEQIHQFIIDTIKSNDFSSMSLAQICFEKTYGNPFFVNQFLHSLYDNKLIFFDEIQGSWIYNISEIKRQNITDNVIDLMAVKIKKLSNKSQDILLIAACIGNIFDLKTLSIVNRKSSVQTAEDLWEAIKEGLIIPIDNSYKFITDNDDNSIVMYKFLHDKVQQAACSLMTEKRQKEIHLKIGRLILETSSEEKRLEKLFNIVNHLNLGSELIIDQAEKNKLAQMNLLAGKRAKASAAYEPSLNYLKDGIRLIGENSWETNYALTLDIYIQTAEAAYLTTDFELMSTLSEIVLKNAKTLLDKIKIYENKIRFLIAQENKQKEAIDTALDILKLLGIKFPKKPNIFHIAKEFLKTKIILAGTKVEDLKNLPRMTDSYILAGTSIIGIIGSAAYRTLPELIPLLVFKAIQLLKKYGNTSSCAYSYAGYAIILCGALGDINLGNRFGKLAYDLANFPDSKKEKTKTYFAVGTIIHWKTHLRESLPIFMDAYQNGLENGDFEFIGHSLIFYIASSYYLGKELNGLENEIKKYRDLIAQLKLGTILPYAKLWRAVVLSLLGRTENPCLLICEEYDENEMLPLYQEVNDKTAICILFFNKLILSYLFQDYQTAIQCSEISEKNLDGVIGSSLIPIFYLYNSLTMLAIFANEKKTVQKRFLKKISKNQKKMEKWAHYASSNYLHKWYLVEAEISRVKGNGFLAMQYYNKAIDLAKENDYIQEQALANELAGMFYLSISQENIAKVYLKEAYYLYNKWGAKAKVSILENRYPNVLKKISSKYDPDFITRSTITASTGTVSCNIDLASVMKASLAISSEIVLTELLKRMIYIVIENAGAQRGILLIEKDEQFFIYAEGRIDDKKLTIMQLTPLESLEDDNLILPISIIKYVIRLKEFIVVDDANIDKHFSKDAYIIRNKPKSILCQPILNKGKLKGILYLENNLTTEAFTPDRVEVLRLLSSQAAISIDNASLYSQLTDKNRDLKLIYEQVNHLLEATKEMSKAKNKVNASQIAMSRMLALESKTKFVDIKLYLPKQSANSFIGYMLWQENRLQNDPTPYDVDFDKANFLKNIKEIFKTADTIIIPLMSKKNRNAYIEIRCNSSEYILNESSWNFIAGIIHSLALTIENIESEENNRMATIGAMAASVVHDLKNPIGIIIGYANLASSDDITTSKRHEYLDIVIKEATRMSLMAHEVLEFSKGELNLQIDENNSKEYMKDLVDMLTPIFIHNNMKLEYEDIYNGIIKFDSEKIRRVILNIATNARDAMIAAKTKDPLFCLKFLRGYKGIQILAKDNGPGISEHIKSTIFEPFVTFGKSHGTGLGMAIVKKIVTAHQGSIDFETEIGKGTTFKIFLPLDEQILNKKENIEKKILPEVNEVKKNNIRILIAEDNILNQQLILRYLNKAGYSADIVSNGKETLSALEKHSYDVVLMDVEMPEMNGIEATKKIRSHDSLTVNRDVPIIAMTAHAMQRDNDPCLQAGMNDYISKPIKPNLLLEIVEKWI